MKLFQYFLTAFSVFTSATYPVALSQGVALSQEEPAIHHGHIAEINSYHNRTWTAGSNAFLLNKSVSDVENICGTILRSERTEESYIENVKRYTSYDTIPDEFDSRNKWPQYIHPIRNQKRCGSCWAFSAAEVLSDRFTIATSGTVDVVLSPQDLVSCDQNDMGCMGGQLFSAWKYMVRSGLVTDACFPYTSGNGDATACRTTCSDTESFVKSKHRAKNYYTLRTVEDIQMDILRHGPVQAAFRVYKSFMSYKSGVYQRNWWAFWDRMLGGHAVKIVGWGTSQKNNKNVDYWLVANSWDTTWGEDGYFKIVRGKNECGIESNVYAGLANVAEL